MPCKQRVFLLFFERVGIMMWKEWICQLDQSVKGVRRHWFAWVRSRFERAPCFLHHETVRSPSYDLYSWDGAPRATFVRDIRFWVFAVYWTDVREQHLVVALIHIRF